VEREPIVLKAARSALANAGGERIRLVHADARDFVPDEPVDVVLCEMMHVGQLRERQIEVIGGFKQRHGARFGRQPRYLPEACVQAVQPVQQDFTFHGYAVAAPQFQDPHSPQDRTIELAAPQVYQQFFYDDPLPDTCAADLTFRIERPGWLNAVRIVTKNILAVVPGSPPSTIDWLMNYLVVPLEKPVYADADAEVRVTFRYQPGDEIYVLASSVEVRLS
jgi:protein arginine N-methyltransferase 1